MFKRAYQKAAKGLDKDLVDTYPSMSTFRRWLAGQIQDLPYPEHCTVLEAMLPGWTAAELFTPYLAPETVDGSTLLRELLRRRCLHTYRDFCLAYDTAAATIDPALVGSYPRTATVPPVDLRTDRRTPPPRHCTVLEAMFSGYSARQLFETPEPPEPARPDEPDQAARDSRPGMSGTAGLILPGEVPAWAGPG